MEREQREKERGKDRDGKGRVIYFKELTHKVVGAAKSKTRVISQQAGSFSRSSYFNLVIPRRLEEVIIPLEAPQNFLLRPSTN